MKALVVTVRRWWLGVSRLPGGLSQAGFEVAAWCPHESFLVRTQGVTRHFAWDSNANWSRELRAIVAEWNPDIVIPGDETIAHFLRKLAGQSSILHPQNAGLRQLLQRSLGDPRASRALDGKIEFQRLATRLGLRTPDDRVVANLADALTTAAKLGYPVVLKDEFAAGGVGVKVCDDSAMLAASWNHLESERHRPASARAKLAHAVGVLSGKIQTRRSIQRFIHGRPAFHAVAAWQGRRLGGVTALVEVTDPPGTGPSCVVRLCELPEVSTACERLVAATGLSGFAGFDFMVEDGTGHTYALECNPRPTPVSHLGGLIGSDLCAAIHDAVANRPPASASPQPCAAERWVAFYPQELLRDPRSPYLATAYLDIPSADAPLMAALLERYPALAAAQTVA